MWTTSKSRRMRRKLLQTRCRAELRADVACWWRWWADLHHLQNLCPEYVEQLQNFVSIQAADVNRDESTEMTKHLSETQNIAAHSDAYRGDELCLQKLADKEGENSVSIQEAGVSHDEFKEEKKHFSEIKKMHKPLTEPWFTDFADAPKPPIEKCCDRVAAELQLICDNVQKILDGNFNPAVESAPSTATEQKAGYGKECDATNCDMIEAELQRICDKIQKLLDGNIISAVKTETETSAGNKEKAGYAKEYGSKGEEELRKTSDAMQFCETDETPGSELEVEIAEAENAAMKAAVSYCEAKRLYEANEPRLQLLRRERKTYGSDAQLCMLCPKVVYCFEPFDECCEFCYHEVKPVLDAELVDRKRGELHALLAADM